MNNLGNDFHASIERCTSEGGRSYIATALHEPSGSVSQLIAYGSAKTHHYALPKHVNAMVQVLDSHQVVRIRHVNTTIYALSNEILLGWSELHFTCGNLTDQAMKLMEDS